MNIEADSSIFDDDGRPKRTGTVWTAGAHIITAVIGSGVLTLAWAIAQMGWIAGPIALLAFSLITLLTATILSDCYRAPDGTRNYVYKDAVDSYLGGIKVQLCALAQYTYLFGVTIGYSITTAISLVAMKKAICFHKQGHEHDCTMSNNRFIVVFGLIQIVLCQVPNFHKLSFLSFIAAIMSFGYASIGLGLSIAKIGEGKHVTTSLAGKPIGKGFSATDKMWNCFAAIGNIAFAYAFSVVLIEIQDTIRSGVPESKVMKQASLIGILISTVFYMLCGILGYAAFGNEAPGNFLTGFGFYEPYWLVFIANLFIAVHLFGAYQVFCQPIFAVVEAWTTTKWPGNKFINREYTVVGDFKLSFFRLIWRSCYVVFVTLVAMLLPFFNDFVGLLGAMSFWPLTVFFPIEMYIARYKISRWSSGRGLLLMLLSAFCLITSLLAAAGSVRGLIHSLRTFKPLHSRS
ncbi:amino acid permease 8 [Perilla frutescens var. frutescens]|nr:amino acid permease 8 [Perilla frutescens var. frutescens]